MSAELKPCPFCSSKNIMIADLTGKGTSSVFCGDCFCKTTNYVDYDESIESWNTRTQPTIADYLKANEPMLTKTKSKMVSIESLKEFAGIKDSDND